MVNSWTTELKPGDVVRLITGPSPEMAVQEVHDNQVQCGWFVGPSDYYEYQNSWFHAASLVKVGKENV